MIEFTLESFTAHAERLPVSTWFLLLFDTGDGQGVSGGISDMGEMTGVAQCTSAQLPMSTRLGPPWSGSLHEGHRRWDDQLVQEVTVVSIQATLGRVVELARESLSLVRFGNGSRDAPRVFMETMMSDWDATGLLRLTTCSCRRGDSRLH